jgi:hypothetical protein
MTLGGTEALLQPTRKLYTEFHALYLAKWPIFIC